MADAPAVRLDRTDYRLEFEDDFDGESLNSTRWLPCYLPQWSSRAASAPRYDLDDGLLRLRIDPDQPPWCPEWDGAVRVSSLQTGVFAGPVGSRVGQHRFHPTWWCGRRRMQPRSTRRGTASSNPSPGNRRPGEHGGALDDRLRRSARAVGGGLRIRDLRPGVKPGSVGVGMGVHPFGDRSITDDFERVTLPIDAFDFHDYAAEWTAQGVRFFVDEQLVREVGQSPDYPMQLMLNVYEFAAGPAPTSAPDRYPKEFAVDWVRGWRRAR